MPTGRGKPPVPHRRHREQREISDLGIVLRRFKLGESDMIVRVLTREHGKRSVVAKGVRRTTSRIGARVEPLTCARFLLHRGRNMDTIKQVEIERSFQVLRDDLELFAYGQAMAELVDSITEEHGPRQELFRLLHSALLGLEEEPLRARFTKAFFQSRVMETSGLGLRVGDCVSCNRKLEGYAGVFSLGLGGLMCEECRREGRIHGGRTIRISSGAARMLLWMTTHDLGEWPDLALAPATGEVSSLMDSVMEHWVEREFRSHKVMKELREQKL